MAETNAEGEWRVGSFKYVDEEGPELVEPPVVDHRLRETGNGPEVNYEEALLREYFGEPDADGVYGKGGDDVG